MIAMNKTDALNLFFRKNGINYAAASNVHDGNYDKRIAALPDQGDQWLGQIDDTDHGPNFPKRITGLVVQNGTVRVPKHFKRTLRQEIHYCLKYGVLTHLENTKSTRSINYREHLYGKAYYINMVEPQEGKLYLAQLDQIEWPSNFIV